MASKLVFIGGALKAPPPATRDAFQMLPQVGLSKIQAPRFDISILLCSYFTTQIVISESYSFVHRFLRLWIERQDITQYCAHFQT